MPSRTWPVFLVGLCTLLALICVPGLVLTTRIQASFDGIRAVQSQYDQGQRTLDAISARITTSSLLVREFLLDSSPANGDLARRRFLSHRAETSKLLGVLRSTIQPSELGPFERLETELQQHAADVLPIFDWTPEERRERATYFLREQQRLRRESLLATAGHIAELHSGNHRTQQAALDLNHQRFRTDLRNIVAAAVLLGMAVAGATVFRIYMLEREMRRHQMATQQAGVELRALSQQLMRAQEAERKSLSRELHDQVGQMLTALRMELGALERKRAGANEIGFQEHLTEAKLLAESTLRTVRDIAVGLRPSLLDDFGLGAALEWETREYSRRAGTPVQLKVEGNLDDLPDAHRICAFRVIQEALTNCARHSNASAIEVWVREDSNQLHLRVKDDGTGCAPADLEGTSIGLRGLRERVRELGGTVEIVTRPGEGLALEATIPIAPMRAGAVEVEV